MPQLSCTGLNTMLCTIDTQVVPGDPLNAPGAWQDQFKKVWNVG